MPSLDFEVYCSECGADLYDDTDVNGLTVKVKPCENCMNREYDQGYADGVDEGMQQTES